MTHPKEDRKLVERCIRGEESAWTEFTRRYDRLIRHAVRRVLSGGAGGGVPDDRVDDLASDVYRRLLEENRRRLREFRWDCSFPGWLYLVASRAARTGLDRLNTQLRFVQESKVPFPAESQGESVSTPLENRDLLETVFARLEPQERRLLEKLYREGESYDQLSQSLSIPRGTLAARVASLKRRLHDLLKRLSSFLLLL